MSHLVKVFLVFFFAFALEVRVKATSEGVSKECLFKHECFQQLLKDTTYTNKNEKFQLLKGSLYKNDGVPRSTHLVQGQVLIQEASSLYTFKNLHSTVEIEFGDALLSVDSKYRASIVNLNGKVMVSLRDGTQIVIPVGFQIWVDGITTEGKNLTGTLQPVDLEQIISEFKVSGKKQLEWKEAQGNLTARASEIYQGSVQRGLAAIKTQEKEQAIIDEKAKQLRKQQRQEVLEKAFSR